MNTTPIKNFAIQSRNVLKQGVLNRILALGFGIDGNVKVADPVKIQGGTIFMDQILDESFYDAWMQLKEKIAAHTVKEVCEEAAYTWFNRLVAIRIMQKNHFIEPVMEYANAESRVPLIVAQARAGRLTLSLSANDREKLNNLLADPTLIDEQFALLIEAYCKSNPVIYNCFGGIEKFISLLLPDNILAKDGFIELLNNTTYITEEDYAQSELIGWLYQFYISEKKDEVFASDEKVKAEDIPAATQIFTPNWIVKYMVQNTLGRTYLDNNPYSSLADQMKYLVKTDEPTPEEAILKLEDVTDYKLIDPACGSGHILVEGFDLLYAMYMDEFYSPREAIENIFKKNLVGIDIDTRAKQLATFSLLMKAAMKDKSFLDCKTMPRVYDMPEPFEYPGLMKEFLAHYGLGTGTVCKECEEAFELLKQASNLGSIMKFKISDATREAIAKRTEEWRAEVVIPERIKTAFPYFNIILALTDKYTAAIMNPPYMGSGKMNDELKSYVISNYPKGKADLFSVFMLLGMDMIDNNGKMGMINMQSWMFISAYEDIRKAFLKDYSFNSLLHLGPHTFDELGGEIVQNVAFVSSKNNHSNSCTFFRLVSGSSCYEKEKLFLSNSSDIIFRNNPKTAFSLLPGSTIGYWASEKSLANFGALPALSNFALGRVGLITGNSNRFIRFWQEVNIRKIGFGIKNNTESIQSKLKWFPIHNGGGFRKWYGNLTSVVNWENDGYELKYDNYIGKRVRSHNYNGELAFKESFSWNTISTDKFTCRYAQPGFMFDTAGPFGQSISKKDDITCIIAFLNSKVADYYFSLINPTINFPPGCILSLPFDNNRIYGNEILRSKGREVIFIAKSDWDAHETSWDFKQNELIRMKHNCGGNVADLDLLDPEEAEEIKSKYNVPTNGNLISDCLTAYKSEWTRNFNKLHSNEEELNRQFIEIYGLQDELKPNVPLNEITILQQGEISIENNEIVWHDDVIIKQLISYAVGCWMGRYRLDKEGLNIAYYPKDEEICSYDVNGYEFTIDDDAIIPLMGHENPFEDDNALQKIVNFVKMVFGSDNLTKNLNVIEHSLGKSIEDYLVKDFWKDHKKMYQNRPIYWLFSSKKGAFQCLVYMHRMNPYTAEKVRTKYLLPYIEYLQGRIQQDKERGADLTTVERKALAKMEIALEECQEYHERLHDVAIHNIDFDLDDGVVVNYAKFGDVLAKIK